MQFYESIYINLKICFKILVLMIFVLYYSTVDSALNIILVYVSFFLKKSSKKTV